MAKRKKTRRKAKRKAKGSRKGKGKKWCVKSGSRVVSKHKKKSSAKKVKSRRHKAGKKARIVAC